MPDSDSSWSLTSKLALTFFVTSLVLLVVLVWVGLNIYKSENTEQRAKPGDVQAYYILTMVVVGVLTLFCLVMTISSRSSLLEETKSELKKCKANAELYENASIARKALSNLESSISSNKK
jgi:hypothetical protein